MHGSTPLSLPKLNTRIEDLECTAEKLKTRIGSSHTSYADRELFGRLLALTEEHLLRMKRTRETLTESHTLLDGCRSRQYPIFRPIHRIIPLL